MNSVHRRIAQCLDIGLARNFTLINAKMHSDRSKLWNNYVARSQLDLFMFDFIYSFSFEHVFESVLKLQVEYGGQNPNITNVLFTNGRLNPLINQGIVMYEADGSKVINIDSKLCIHA